MADMIETALGQVLIDDVAIDRGDLFEIDPLWTPEVLEYRRVRWHGRKPTVSFMMLPHNHTQVQPTFEEGVAYNFTMHTDHFGRRTSVSGC